MLRVVVGGLLMAHGSQKLFGWFGGHGLAGTGGWMESMGMRPGKLWAALAGLGEFGGGLLLLLGFLTPLGSIAVISVMAMAWLKAHLGKPIWAQEGGAELPLVNVAAALALALAGPGEYSLDAALGIALPSWLVAIVAIFAAVTVIAGAMMRPPQTATTEQETEELEREPIDLSASRRAA